MTNGRYVVVGGGISGLSAAHALGDKFPDAEIVLLEARARIGGKIITDRTGGYVLEGGPDSILRRKPEAIDLATGLGLTPIGTNPGTRGAFIYYHGRFFPIPVGIQAGIPTDIKALLKSRLLSWSGKFRASLDFVLPRITDRDQDMALGRFLRYRFGDEVVDRLAAPMLSGIYAGDIDQMSLEATFPQFKDLERDSRSVVLGSRRRQRLAKPSTTSGSLFASFPRGLESLTETLAEAMTSVEIRYNAPVDRLESQDNIVQVRLGDVTIEADGVVLAVPAFVAASLIQDVSPMVAHVLREIAYPNLAVVGAIYAPDAINVPDHKTGFLVPRQPKIQMTAGTYVSSKWHYPGVPEGKVIRAFYGHAGDDILRLSDQELSDLYHQEMSTIFPKIGKPFYQRVFRHPSAIPQYQVGHVRKMQAALTQMRQDWPRVVLAGAYIDGVGIPDCVRRARLAVEELG